MPRWVRLCGKAEAPDEGKVMEVEVAGISVCLAQSRASFSALSNWCPHRNAPLGEGWLEDGVLVCPWHSWTFALETGQSIHPGNYSLEHYPLRVEGEQILIDLERDESGREPVEERS